MLCDLSLFCIYVFTQCNIHGAAKLYRRLRLFIITRVDCLAATEKERERVCVCVCVCVGRAERKSLREVEVVSWRGEGEGTGGEGGGEIVGDSRCRR